jgi:hypothetical protein
MMVEFSCNQLKDGRTTQIQGGHTVQSSPEINGNIEEPTDRWKKGKMD